MSSKLKALGVGILAVLAIGAFAAVNASAEPEEEEGHLVSEGSETENTTITGTEDTDTEHYTEFSLPGLSPIICHEVLYEGTMETDTVHELTVTATYHKCTTTGDETVFTVDMNGCNYLFTIGDFADADNTVHLKCPEGKSIEITHPSCTIKVPEQTLKGAAYTTDTTVVDEETIHTITLDVTVENITSHFEGGFCVLLGTKHTGKLDGSVTVEGYEDLGNDPETHPHGTEGPLVDITATGFFD